MTNPGSTEILQLLISTLDGVQLQQILSKIRRKKLVMFNDSHLVPMLTRSLEWDTWEQNCVWTLVGVHKFNVEEFLPIIPQLDSKQHAEAVTALQATLTSKKPTQEIVGPLFCRRPNINDSFVIDILVDWSDEYEDDLAEVLAGAIVRATGSPVKRKRGPTAGSRGTSSPAGPPTPTVEQVLGHLDHLRLETEEGGIFSKDIMQAALLQIQSFVTDTQKVKYRELLALAAEEPDVKESRSGTPTKRATTPRKLPSSPTSSSPTNFGGSGSNNSGGSGSGSASSLLSRTRSGRTRQALKDESTDTSDDDDDIPLPKRVKRRKNNSALNSDSD
jgi:integrator complex subunit 3